MKQVFRFALSFLLSLPAHGFAEDLSSFLLPSRLPKLPSPESKEKLAIVAENEELFRELLLASTSNWLTSKKFRIEVYSKLNYQIARQEIEDEDLIPVLQRADQIEAALLAASRRPNILPFGDADRVNSVPDVKLRARKILWNAQFATRAGTSIGYDMQLFWFNGNQPPREAAGSLKRVFQNNPSLKLEELSTLSETKWEDRELFYAESFRLTTPPAIFGFQDVALRSLRKNRDILWHYSPALGKTRAVVEAIRGDGMLEGVLSADDFFVFSPKIQQFDARVVADKMLFLPFASLNEIPRSEQNVFVEVESDTGAATEAELAPQKQKEIVDTFFGEYQTFDGSRTMVHWNFHGPVAAEYPLWLPISAVFVPRRVWIVETYPMDPFYRYGRIVLAVDQQTFLPHFAMLYDRRGNYQKTVMGIWGHGRVAAEQQVPFLAGLLVVDRTLLRAAVVSTSFVNIGADNTPIFAEGIWKELLAKRKVVAEQEQSE